MQHPLPPLTATTVLSSWRLDPATIIVVAVVCLGYLWLRHGTSASRSAAAVFLVGGVGTWVVASCSFIGVYSDTLFWVRALQFVLLTMVVPFGLALGKPISLVTAHPRIGPRVDTVLSGRAGRVLASPPVTSVLLLATPWLVYLTGWYPALLDDAAIDVVTRLWLVLVGFGYFYVRLQVDPVPRAYSPGLSLLISAGEAIGDGVLGVVLWQGPLLAAAHYESLHRMWGPSLRTDQTIGAGVLWILGDVIGVPFLLVLFGHFTADDQRRARTTDEALDAESGDEDAPSQLWWEADPQLRARFGDRR